MQFWMYERDTEYGAEYVWLMDVNLQTGEVRKVDILKSRDLSGDDEWLEEEA